MFFFLWFSAMMSVKTKNCDSESTDSDGSISPTPLFGRIFDESDPGIEAIFPTDSSKVVSANLRAIQWSIPVEPGGALEKVLLACNKLTEIGQCENCSEFSQFFSRDAVSLFTKLLNDAAGQNWDDITNVTFYLLIFPLALYFYALSFDDSNICSIGWKGSCVRLPRCRTDFQSSIAVTLKFFILHGPLVSKIAVAKISIKGVLSDLARGPATQDDLNLLLNFFQS